MNLSDRLAAVQRQYVEMEQNIATLNKAEKQAEKSYIELNQLLEKEQRARSWMVRDLRYHWLWTVSIAFIGGFFGAVTSAAAVRFFDWMVAGIYSFFGG